MDRKNWIQYGLFLVGVCALVGAVAVGIAAVEYEYEHQTSSTEIAEIEDEMNQYGVTDYEELTDEQQTVVDELASGERYVVGSGDEISSWFGEGVVISQGDQYHVTERSTSINWSSTPGIAAILLAATGLVLIAEGFRRQYF